MNGLVENIVLALKNGDIKQAVQYFIVEQNDEITNAVRKKLSHFTELQIKNTQSFLAHLLNLCYSGKLFLEEIKEDDSLIETLNPEQLFLFKETVIYYLGRLSVLPDIEVLKKAYLLDDNKYIQLNLAYATLCTFDEEVELDFVKKCSPRSEFDSMLRSWTMAFFTKASNPYQYVDNPLDDWTPAKLPRIKRLSINDEANPNFRKAMAFRLFDLLVIYLFLENRKKNDLSLEERTIIEQANIDYEQYSPSKKELMETLKKNILTR